MTGNNGRNNTSTTNHRGDAVGTELKQQEERNGKRLRVGKMQMIISIVRVSNLSAMPLKTSE